MIVRNAYRGASTTPLPQPERSLLQEVEMFLRHHRLAPSRLGRLATNDSALVLNLRNGREPSETTARKVRAFMAGYSA